MAGRGGDSKKSKGDSVPTEAIEQVVQRYVKSEIWACPLPPPSVLEGYEQVCSGSAERILKDFEKQTEHRHQIEKAVIHDRIQARKTAQLFAFVIALAGFVLIGWLAHLGHAVLAGVFGFVELASLVAVFIQSSRRDQRTVRSSQDERNKINN